jgi:hypothetical protein
MTRSQEHLAKDQCSLEALCSEWLQFRDYALSGALPAIDSAQYIRQKVNPDEIDTRQVSVNLAELMQGKTVEDLLELE